MLDARQAGEEEGKGPIAWAIPLGARVPSTMSQGRRSSGVVDPVRSTGHQYNVTMQVVMSALEEDALPLRAMHQHSTPYLTLLNGVWVRNAYRYILFTSICGFVPISYQYEIDSLFVPHAFAQIIRNPHACQYFLASPCRFRTGTKRYETSTKRVRNAHRTLIFTSISGFLLVRNEYDFSQILSFMI